MEIEFRLEVTEWKQRSDRNLVDGDRGQIESWRKKTQVR